jgi:hypothetical protein
MVKELIREVQKPNPKLDHLPSSIYMNPGGQDLGASYSGRTKENLQKTPPPKSPGGRILHQTISPSNGPLIQKEMQILPGKETPKINEKFIGTMQPHSGSLLEGAAKLETPPKRHNHREVVQQNEEEKKRGYER